MPAIWPQALVTTLPAIELKQPISLAKTIPPSGVRCSFESSRQRDKAALTLCATSGLTQCSKTHPHSITSSARSCIAVQRISMPSALAVFRLITNSNLLDCPTGKSAGFSPLRNPPSLDTHQAIHVRKAVAVCHQTASVSKVAQVVDRRYPMACCQRDNLIAPIKEKRIGGTEKRSDSLLHHTCECSVKLAFAACIKNNNFPSERGGCRLRGCHFNTTVRIVWIHKKSDDGVLRREVMQQLQPLGDRGRTKYGDTISIAPWPVEAVY